MRTLVGITVALLLAVGLAAAEPREHGEDVTEEAAARALIQAAVTLNAQAQADVAQAQADLTKALQLLDE